VGLPCVAVPTGVSDDGPLGVQLVASRFREDLCLDAAEAIEKRAGLLTPIDPVS
jgi:amidase